MPKLVDFFPYFNETGKQLLELRVNVLKDYVNEFIICESNKTQSGISIPYQLEETIEELGLPQDKIRIIYLKIPEDEQLDIQLIDKYNCSENYDFENIKNGDNLNSLRARVRERMQKDALLHVLNEYNDDDIFLHSDSDEIINPKHLPWILNVVKNTKDSIIKIPLVNLEGRADLRVFFKSTNSPKAWDGGMFFATKSQLKKANPSQIRSNVLNPLPIVHIVDNGKVVQDLGWHFSWMGDASIRMKKCKAFAHYDDKFTDLIGDKYSSDSLQKFLVDLEPKEGEISPSGLKDTILKKYPHEELPPEVFNLPRVKKYLLPNIEKSFRAIISVSTNTKPTVAVVDNFYENPDEVREFALNQEYVEGGFGRGFIGRRTEQQFLFPGLKERFEGIIGKKITAWEEYGMNGRFQIAWAGEPLVWHCDSQTYGGMLYLTPKAPYQCGTTLYAHKKTRARTYYDEGWDVEWGKENGTTHLDGTPWEPVDVMGNVYNRLVIFDGSCIHSASQYFGSCKENARLWQMFFFDT